MCTSSRQFCQATKIVALEATKIVALEAARIVALEAIKMVALEATKIVALEATRIVALEATKAKPRNSDPPPSYRGDNNDGGNDGGHTGYVRDRHDSHENGSRYRDDNQVINGTVIGPGGKGSSSMNNSTSGPKGDRAL